MKLIERIRAVRDAVRARLIDDCRAIWKRWSVWLSAAGALLSGFALAWPQQALAVWNSLPADVREHIPGGTMFVPTLLFVAVPIAQMIKQGKSNG
jgi:hypothetical protein